MAYQFELYHYWRSSCSWRVRWALNHKGLSYKSHTVNLLKNEHQSLQYLSINPAGCVPALLINGKPMADSIAIIEWLEEVFPANPLLPSAPDERAYVRRLVQTIASGVFPIQNLSVQKYVEAHGLDRAQFARHWIEKGLRIYEALITTNGVGGSYSFGGHVTMADLCLIPQVANAVRVQVDLQPYPNIKRIYDTCLRLPHCDKAAPQNQPDAVK